MRSEPHRVPVARGWESPVAPRAARRQWLSGRTPWGRDPAVGADPGRRRRGRGDVITPPVPRPRGTGPGDRRDISQPAEVRHWRGTGVRAPVRAGRHRGS